MLSNKTSHLQVVKIIRKDGVSDSINLQPNVRKVELEEGTTIDPIQYSTYVGKIGGIENYMHATTQAAVASGATLATAAQASSTSTSPSAATPATTSTSTTVSTATSTSSK